MKIRFAIQPNRTNDLIQLNVRMLKTATKDDDDDEDEDDVRGTMRK